MKPPPRHPRLVGLAAFVALMALLVGLPTVLLALGWGSMPSGLDGWWAALTTPDDGHLTILVLKVAAWIVWGLLAITIITEAFAALRGLEAPRLPGLGWSQVPARRLVTAALLLFITVPATGIETASAVPDSPSPVATATATVAPAPSAPVGAPSKAAALVEIAPAPVTHTVKRGETLWSIAEHHLASGSRYPEILKLNNELLRGKAQFLRPGWVLTLPAGAQPDGGRATAANDRDHSRYTVVKGDTLSEIAQEHLERRRRLAPDLRGLPEAHPAGRPSPDRPGPYPARLARTHPGRRGGRRPNRRPPRNPNRPSRHPRPRSPRRLAPSPPQPPRPRRRPRRRLHLPDRPALFPSPRRAPRRAPRQRQPRLPRRPRPPTGPATRSPQARRPTGTPRRRPPGCWSGSPEPAASSRLGCWPRYGSAGGLSSVPVDRGGRSRPRPRNWFRWRRP